MRQDNETPQAEMTGQSPCQIKKPCCICGREKPLLDFHQKPKALHGRDSRCKICVLRGRKNQRAMRRRRKRDLDLTQFRIGIVGSVDTESIDDFARAFSGGISHIIEEKN